MIRFLNIFPDYYPVSRVIRIRRSLTGYPPQALCWTFYLPSFIGLLYTVLNLFGVDVFYKDMRKGYGFAFTEAEFEKHIDGNQLNEVLISFKPIRMAESLSNMASALEFSDHIHGLLSPVLRDYLAMIDRRDYMFDRFSKKLWLFESIEKNTRKYVGRNYELETNVVKNLGIRFRNESDAIMYKLIVKYA